MRILFATPDRDLSECYKRLLDESLGETVTAFDGAQVMNLIAAESFDAAVIDRGIPRVGIKTLTAKIKEKGIPVIALSDEPPSARRLAEEPLPSACLSYPFDSKKLCAVITDAAGMAAGGAGFEFGKAEIDVSGFCIKGGASLTASEINVLAALAGGKTPGAGEGLYVAALNKKLARAGAGVRIKYAAKKGYITVSENE